MVLALHALHHGFDVGHSVHTLQPHVFVQRLEMVAIADAEEQWHKVADENGEVGVR